MNSDQRAEIDLVDSPYAWRRLWVCVVLATIGNVGLWSFAVVLPAVQADFGISRADASLPYTTLYVGFAAGGMLMGRLTDRFGISTTAILGTITLCTGFLLTAWTQNIWQLAAANGILIGIGSSTTFAPLIADVSHFFLRRRGIAIAIVASGNYLSGTIWPPILQHFITTSGWRATHIGVAIFCVCTLVPLALLLRRRPLVHDKSSVPGAAMDGTPSSLGLSTGALQTLLMVAGFACCAAMSMPQVHIVAYCGDLGYGVARGAEMLSAMLALGIVSRLASGFIADRIGGLATLLIGSALQMFALTLYLVFNGLISLYVISAMFGLFQGGIVPSYAIIVREYFSPKEAGSRVGVVIMATLFGMAFGGWISGVIYDWTGSYQAAFVNGIGWNLLNVLIAFWLLWRAQGGGRLARA